MTATQTGHPLYDQAGAVLRQAADMAGVSGGSVAAASLVIEASKIVTAAVAQKAELSARQRVLIESLLANLSGALLGVGEGAMALAIMADHIAGYKPLEQARDELRRARRDLLTALAAAGAARVEYVLTEARLRGGEAAYTAFTKQYMMAKNLSMVLSAALTLNPALIIVSAGFMAIDHAIWKKRHETMRRRRSRSVAEFAVTFAAQYQNRDRVERAVREFRQSEDALFVDGRIEALVSIKRLWDGLGNENDRDSVYILLALPTQDFVDGIDALTRFYEAADRLSLDEITKVRRALGERPGAGGVSEAGGIDGVVRAALVAAGAWVLWRVLG